MAFERSREYLKDRPEPLCFLHTVLLQDRAWKLFPKPCWGTVVPRGRGEGIGSGAVLLGLGSKLWQ